MKIIKPSKKDVLRLAQLMNEYDIYENKLDKNFEISSVQETVKLIESQFKERDVSYLAAEVEGKIQGLVNYSVERIGKKKRGILHNLYISKEYRKSGLGKKLIASCLMELKKSDCKSVRSKVLEKNTAALEYWKKQGWKAEKATGYSITKSID